MQTGKQIEQVILTRSEGSIDALIVTEAPSGARQRERWPSIAADVESAIDRIAVQLARRGDVDGVGAKLRIRLGRGDELIERSDLIKRLKDRFRHALDEA